MQTRPTPGPLQAAPWLGLAAVLLVSTLMLWPGLGHPLNFDDVVTRDDVRSYGSPLDAFGKDAFQLFRPLKNLFFYFMEQAAAESFAYHVGTLLCYHLATAGVFFMAWQLSSRASMAVAAAAIWSLSAANVTVAHWASCVNISLAIAAMTTALALWDRWRERGSRLGTAGAAGVLLFLACCSYETAVATAPIAVLTDLYRGRRIFDRKSLAAYSVIALIVLGYLAWRHVIGGKMVNLANPGFNGDIDRWQVSASAPYFLWTHFTMWLAPWGKLEFLGSYLWNKSVPATALPFCWAFLIGGVFLCVRFWKPGNLLLFGAAWFLVASIPSGNFIPLMNTPTADYYVPLPAVGLALAFTALCRRLILLMRRGSGHRWISVAAGTVVVALVASRIANLTAFATWLGAWAQPAELMARTAEAKPHQFFAKSVAAEMLLDTGNLDLSEPYARSAIADTDDLALPYVVLGRIELERGNYAAALGHLSEAMRQRFVSEDTFTSANHFLGVAIAQAAPERLEEARAHFVIALKNRSYPRHAEAVADLATMYENAGNSADAREVILHGLEIHPNHPDLLDELKKLEPPASSR